MPVITEKRAVLQGLSGEDSVSVYWCGRRLCGTRCTYGNLCDSDHRTFSACTSWKRKQKAYADMKRRQEKHLPGVRRTEKKNEDRQKKQRQNRMILPEEVIIKYRVFLLQQRCRPRKVKCQRRQQRKSVKEFFRKRSGYAGTDCFTGIGFFRATAVSI